MNNLYEFGGSCDVVIRCNTRRKIGNSTYEINEPYTILRDVFVNINYSNITSESSARNNILAAKQGLPDSVLISNITLTDKVNCLIAEKISPKTIGKYYTATAENKTIYLPEIPVNNNIYVYNKNEPIRAFTRDGEKLVGDFIDYETYLIFYEILSEKDCFNFDTPSHGYFCLEIYGKGNTDKVSEDVYIKIPAVSLMSVPVFDMVNGDILHAPMQFKIIHLNQEKSYYNIGG